MLNLDELLLDGKEGCGMARGDVQFTIDGAQVGIDRARADDQGLGDLGIGEASCHQRSTSTSRSVRSFEEEGKGIS